MLTIRHLAPYAFFAIFGAIAFVYGTGFAWTAGVKHFFLSMLIVLFFEKLLGEELVEKAYQNKVAVAAIAFVVSGILFYYGIHLESLVDYSQPYDEVFYNFTIAVLIMANAGIIFTFAGGTLFRKE